MFHAKSISMVRSLSYVNDYPKAFFDTCLCEKLRKMKFGNQNNKNDLGSIAKCMCRISIPFKHRFYKQCSKSLKKCKISTRSLLNDKLNNVIKSGEDAFNNWEKTGVVYNFQCKNCPMSYGNAFERWS